jgi:hypothetical protein
MSKRIPTFVLACGTNFKLKTSKNNFNRCVVPVAREAQNPTGVEVHHLRDAAWGGEHSVSNLTTLGEGHQRGLHGTRN